MKRLVAFLVTAGGALILLTTTSFGKPVAAGFWIVGFLVFVTAGVIVLKDRREGDSGGKFNNG
jgi:hypothetical protein